MDLKNKLSKRGKDIYDEILAWVGDKFEEIDRYEVFRLADAYDQYFYFVDKINKDPSRGMVTYKNGTTNVGGLITCRDKAGAIIDGISKRFGITPEAREKLKAFETTKDKKHRLIK